MSDSKSPVKPNHTSLWVPLGYSPLLSHRSGEINDGVVHIDMQALERILGSYKTIAFHTKRLGDYFFEVLMVRTGVVIGGEEVVLRETFAGSVRRLKAFKTYEADVHLLKTGQELYIEGMHRHHVQLVLVGSPLPPGSLVDLLV